MPQLSDNQGPLLPRQVLRRAGEIITRPSIGDFSLAQHSHLDAVGGGRLSSLVLDNPYKFKVWRNAAANTGNGAYALVAFDTEDFDTGSSVAGGVFIVPTNGYYQFNWNIAASLSSGADEVFLATLFRNGAEHSRGNIVAYRNEWGSHGSDLLALTEGEEIDIRTFATTARALSVGSRLSCYFSGFLVSVA
jgi:hypothetical protein